MNPITEILPGRLTYDELKKAKAEQFAPFRGGEGVKHVDRKYILYKDVDYGTTEDNPVRVNGSSGVAVTKLADSRRQGIDPSAELPCVSINKNEDSKKAYKASELSFTKYCSVSKTLEATADISFSVYVNNKICSK